MEGALSTESKVPLPKTQEQPLAVGMVDSEGIVPTRSSSNSSNNSVPQTSSLQFPYFMLPDKMDYTPSQHLGSDSMGPQEPPEPPEVQLPAASHTPQLPQTPTNPRRMNPSQLQQSRQSFQNIQNMQSFQSMQNMPSTPASLMLPATPMQFPGSGNSHMESPNIFSSGASLGSQFMTPQQYTHFNQQTPQGSAFQFPSTPTPLHAPQQYSYATGTPTAQPTQPMQPIWPEGQEPPAPAVANREGQAPRERPSNYAEEASKYVQIQFALTQRHGQACNLCKVRKIKCDTRPMGCLNCEKMKMPCQDLCRLSGKSVPRGQAARLQEKVDILKSTVASLKGRLAAATGSSDIADIGEDAYAPTDPRPRFVHWLQKSKESSEELLAAIDVLKDGDTQSGSPRVVLWQNIQYLVRKLLSILQSGCLPPPMEMAILKNEIKGCSIDLAHEERAISNGPGFTDAVRGLLTGMYINIAKMPAGPQAGPQQIGQLGRQFQQVQGFQAAQAQHAAPATLAELLGQMQQAGGLMSLNQPPLSYNAMTGDNSGAATATGAPKANVIAAEPTPDVTPTDESGMQGFFGSPEQALEA